MLLEENPFYILGVHSQSDKNSILEAAEDKSFDDTENEDAYNRARDILLNPHKRIAAEVSWFLGVSSADLKGLLDDLEHVYTFQNEVEEFVVIVNRLKQLDIETAVKQIIRLDSLYTELLPEKVRFLINADRKSAGFPLVQEVQDIQQGIHGLEDDVHRAIQQYTKKLKRPVYSRLANEIAENVSRNKNIFGSILTRFFDTYKLDMSTYVLKEQADMEQLFKNETYTSDFFLNHLESHVRVMSSITKAECILIDSRGEDSFSSDVENYFSTLARNALAIRDEGRRDIAYKIFLLLKECFPLVAKRYKDFESILQDLKRNNQPVGRPVRRPVGRQSSTFAYKEAETAFEEILKQIEAEGHFEAGYENQNRNFLQNSFEKSFKKIVEEFIRHSGSTPEEKEAVFLYASLIYLQVGNLYTWINDAKLANEYGKKAQEYARLGSDQKIYNAACELVNATSHTVSHTVQSATAQSGGNANGNKTGNGATWIVCICIFLGICGGGIAGGVIGFIIGCVIANAVCKS